MSGMLLADRKNNDRKRDKEGRKEGITRKARTGVRADGIKATMKMLMEDEDEDRGSLHLLVNPESLLLQQLGLAVALLD